VAKEGKRLSPRSIRNKHQAFNLEKMLTNQKSRDKIKITDLVEHSRTITEKDRSKTAKNGFANAVELLSPPKT
jgi:hypothetical protein